MLCAWPTSCSIESRERSVKNNMCKLSNIRPEILDEYQERFEALESEDENMYGLLEIAIKIGLLVLESKLVSPNLVGVND